MIPLPQYLKVPEIMAIFTVNQTDVHIMYAVSTNVSINTLSTQNAHNCHTNFLARLHSLLTNRHVYTMDNHTKVNTLQDTGNSFVTESL